MHSDPFPDTESNGGNLFIFHPDPGVTTISAGLYGEVIQGSDEHLFEVTQILVSISSPLPQVKDGVADYLSGPW